MPRASKGATSRLATVQPAAAALAPSYPELRFQIVGDGPRRAELEALAQARNLQGVVEFLGHREDVPALLAALPRARTLYLDRMSQIRMPSWSRGRHRSPDSRGPRDTYG